MGALLGKQGKESTAPGGCVVGQYKQGRESTAPTNNAGKNEE